MRIGIDTYSFHRLLGQPRPSEQPAEQRLPDGGPAVLAIARELGCDVVSLQTCFLGLPGSLDLAALRAAAGELDVVLAWGHPEGLAFGTRPQALDELHEWIEVAGALGGDLMRIVVGGPALRGVDPWEVQLARTVEPLREAAAHASRHGITLAIENHGDMPCTALVELIERASAPSLGVCFDTANAPRVGEDACAAARLVAPLLAMVHLKDIEAPEHAADFVAGPCTVPFGAGIVPVAAVLDALAAPIAAGAPVCVEVAQVASGVDELALVAEGVRWLNERRAPST